MSFDPSALTQRRIIAILGHYGSGKTELAVSLALLLAHAGRADYPQLALADLDIANPYFRSRERRALLEQAGIGVYGSAYRGEITAELPALGADVRAPLEDAGCRCIVDLGGNAAGAKVIRQFGQYFTDGSYAAYAVVNANRPETATPQTAIAHLRAIEDATGLALTGIVNNCHLLRETTAGTIAKGQALCAHVARQTGLPVICTCYPAPLVQEAALLEAGLTGPFLPLGLYMRESWLDLAARGGRIHGEG